ncbi:UDP-N-acetylmuramoyl-L-alanyl-D-glutamate--2,6-diaminopimelate ligase [Candidatus Poribacteria bacterium]|nr:UDP-N-acetylmuramoyl-L-alanyl-D-glutamate--2,6-diaminopimelate ligase [Candidatus Poribacteria bacterium]
MNLQQLLDRIEVNEITGDRNPEIAGVVSDHRQVKPGYVFVCYQGLNVDGHSFISGAIKNGARVVISEKQTPNLPNDVTGVVTSNGRRAQALCAANWFGNPAERLKLTGITGTNGKTSTAHLTYGILSTDGYKTAVLGTVGHSFDSASNGKEPSKIEIPALLTTPDAFQLHAMLKQIADAGVDHVVMETSSQGLAQHRLTGLTFDTAVFTNLTQDHLDYHGSMDNYLTAKMMLFEQLSPTGVAILNADSTATPRIIQHIQNRKILTYGLEKAADLEARDVDSSLHQLAFTAVLNKNDVFSSSDILWNEIQPTIGLLGEYNIYNALAAISVGLRYNCSATSIRNGLSSTVVPGRFERIMTNGKPVEDFAVIVDYAHTPDGLKNVLTAARGITEGRLISVFGCGGDRDSGKRPKMGAISTQIADMSVITSDNPRTENPDEIILDIVSKLPHDAAFSCISERREAIRHAILNAKPGDVVVIAGKGHEDYQEINGRRFPFDDRAVAAEILQNLPKQSKHEIVT